MMLQPQFITNEVATARFEHTIKGIDDEINMKLGELNAMLETPKKTIELRRIINFRIVI